MATIRVVYHPALLLNAATLVGSKRIALSWSGDHHAANGRVVFFAGINRHGAYASGGGDIGVPWSLTDFILDADALTYRIESDSAHATFPFGPPALPRADWATVDFEVQCGGCGFVSLKRTQTNHRMTLTHVCGKCAKPILRGSGDDIAITAVRARGPGRIMYHDEPVAAPASRIPRQLTWDHLLRDVLEDPLPA